MMVAVVEKNKDGKIELTKEELDEMLKNAYNEGRADECRLYKPNYPTWEPGIRTEKTIKDIDKTNWVTYDSKTPIKEI